MIVMVAMAGLVTACAGEQVVVAAAVTPITTPLPVPSATPTMAPTAAPTVMPSPSPGATADPADPFAGIRMDDFAARSYGGSGIVLDDVVTVEPGFTQYTMHYDSDGLVITGLVNIPHEGGPFPVIVVNHGYLRPEEYRAGFDSWRMAEWLANAGYIAFMPDYRNYGRSDSGPNPFRTGYATDVMNLVAQVASFALAAPGQIGIMGHSMGGEASMWAMILSDEVDAVVLYASMSGNSARNWEHRYRHWPIQREAMEALALVYGTPAQNPAGYAAISPDQYYDRIAMPVMIHHGTMDETVPYWWAEDTYTLMQAAGVDVTFWPYPGGKHTLTGNGFAMLMQRSTEFFDLHVRGNVNSPNKE